jgi:hypothetical protein
MSVPGDVAPLKSIVFVVRGPCAGAQGGQGQTSPDGADKGQIAGHTRERRAYLIEIIQVFGTI